MIGTSSTVVTEILNKSSFIETYSTRQVTTLRWPQGVSSITYLASKCIVSEKELQGEIDKLCKSSMVKKILKATTVKVVDLGWILKDEKNFLLLTQILNLTANDQIFITTFVKQILDQMWDKNFYKLLKYQFLPFIACLSICISYLHYSLEQDSFERE